MDFQKIVREKAMAYGLDPNVAEAAMMQESGGNPNAVSPKGAMSLMQLMPGTAKELGVDPMDPVQNIDGGVRYLKQQVDKFGVAGGLAAYNAGPGRYERSGRNLAVLPQETQNYVPSIMNRAALIAERNQVVGQAQPVSTNMQPNTQQQPAPQSPPDLPTLLGGYQKATAAKDMEASNEIGGLIRQRYQSALSKAQAAGDAEAVAEIQQAMGQFGGSAPAPAPAAPVAVAPPAAPPAATQAAPVKSTTPSRSIGRRVDDFVRGVADTVTFGYADEIAAKMDSLVGGGQSGKKAYDEALAAQRQRDKEGGGERIAGQVTGALAPTVGVIRSVDGASRLGRMGAGVATGAIQGGLYGTGSADGDTASRIEGGKTGAIIGGIGGGVINTLIPTTVRQEGNRFIKRAGSDALAKIDAEVVVALDDIFQRAVRSQGGKQRPSMAIDANAVASRYVNEAREALSKLDPKTVPNLDQITFEIANRGSTPSAILDQLSQTPAGKAVVDALLKADRVRTLTGQKLATGGAAGSLVRMGVEAAPAIASAKTGVPIVATRSVTEALTNKLGASVPRAKVIDKLLSPKQVKAAKDVARVLGPSDPTLSMGALNKTIELANKATADQKAAESAALLAKQQQASTTRLQVLQDTRRPLSGAFQELLPNGRSGLNLNSKEAVDALRLVSRQLKDRPVGQAAKDILRSGNVPDENAFYGLQNQVRKLQEGGLLGNRPGALTEASSVPSVVRNPQSNQAAIDTAQAARQLAVDNAPNKALAQFANTVAATVNPAEKLKLVEDRLAKTTDPAIREYLETLVKPLTKFGAKAKK